MSLEKHEYFNGEIFMLAGGSPNHNAIGFSLTTEMKVGLRGSKCRPFNNETKILVQDNGLYTYADGSIVCGPVQRASDSTEIITNPTVIFEVVSPTSEKYDKGEKFKLYRGLESLQEYIIIYQDKPYIEQYVKQRSDNWSVSYIEGTDAELQLSSVNYSLPLRQIYEDVEWLNNDD